MKYRVVHTYGGTYGRGAVYKIYSVEEEGDEWVVKEPIAGIYFSLRRGSPVIGVKYDTYREAFDFVKKDSIKSAFSYGLHPKYKKAIKEMEKHDIKE